MTRDEILAMEAGRKLDALVMEKVMGWEREMFRGQEKGSLWPDECIYRLMLEHGFSHRYRGRLERVPWLSTDIAVVWEVVEAVCKAHGLYFRLHRTPDYVWAAFDRWSDARLSVEAQADDAPEAICKAVLLAVTEGA